MSGLLSKYQEEAIHDLAKTEINKQLLIGIDTHCQFLDSLGIKAKPFSPKSLKDLNTLDDSSKRLIIDNIYSELSAHENAKSLDNAQLLLGNKFIASKKLKASDEFLETIKDNHIVEIYSNEMKQVYRSLNFYEYTGYSLLDLMLYELYDLWRKPAASAKALATLAQFTLENKVPLVSMKGIKPYLNVEVLDTGLTSPFIPRVNILAPQYVGYLTSSEYLEHEYVIATCVSEKIDSSSIDLNSISHI